MSNVYVKLNKKGVSELLKSPEAQSLVNDIAGLALGGLSDGYEMEVRVTDRAVAVVYAATTKARIQNSKNNTILKAVGAAKV